MSGTNTAGDGAVDAAAAEKQRLASAIEFVKGNPSAEDVAAIVTVLAAATSGTVSGPPAPKNSWAPVREKMRPQYYNGPNTYTSLTPLFYTGGH
ncbi:acyl-CoA carboxylase subunit epsilon [Tsukamurella sp. 8F]|uniref:acyl-CoA carboxylase subunit epsilon n=1 Tax=unclassified Tsukamurella TaxID=2633480 RepID=UPI0023B93039|nr:MULTISPECIES: acyl-CoA carboxylase subunit epsilon [unclassified Tsukamurella]MDF0529010.1 acyl-CoA carboxylase subunit epsilon [Tsukamurella sp. 8J]MDF0587383.1 acyl-CoA carboxylase subunit epsilon [Tsukamurella sp. 8F]